jgi:aspartyl-tRNA synthetase
MCGALRASDAGKKATLMGWVNKRRDLGSLIFVDLRDRTGVAQVVINAERDAAIHKKAEALRNEYVIAVTGTVKLRDASTVNNNIATGEVELVAEELRILNESKLPPFLPSDTALTNEETRLKYRYIDLRRDVMQFNIEMRHKVAKAIRDYLSAQGFLEIETPFMTRSTPEGARDYLVPSRVQPGTFYALPQSPQMFKQILMISGFDKYFQIVRCFRDEDLRADRQPEFTQIDLEMSYPQPERVWEVVEGFLTAAFAAAGSEIKTPFPRMDYDEAIRLYGIDKPDLRLPPFTDVRDCFSAENLQELAINPNLPVIAIRTPKVGDLSRKERDDIKPLFHAKGGAKIFEDFKRIGNKFPEAAAAIAKKTGMEESDLIVIVAESSQAGSSQSGSTQVGSAQAGPQTAGSGQRHRKVTPQELAVYASAGVLRLALAQKYSERHGIFKKTGDPAKDYRFLWVTNFPMFEWDEGEKSWMAAHHPFTSPHEEDMSKLEPGVEALHDPLSPLSAVRALAYDVVLNGTELGSGSIRIHRQDVQSRIFRALGMTDEEARARFGFFLEALEYGTPPHGGIALGLDRIVMILAGAESLREVIPFPKTARAVDLMVDAPTSVVITQEEQLELIAAWPELTDREWKLARLCDDLLEAVTKEILSRNLPVDTSYQQASAVILGKAWNDAKAAVKLVKAGYGVQAAGVSRSLVEAAINLRYIEKDPENRATAFLRLMDEENRRLIARVKLHPVSQETQEAIDRMQGVAQKSSWPMSIMERAYAVQKPSYDYDVVFPMLSQLLHSTPPAMVGQLRQDGQQQFRLQIGRSNEWLGTALATVFIFFAQIADSSFKTFDLNNERLESLTQEFIKVDPGSV